MKKKQGFLKWSYHVPYTRPTILKGNILLYHSDDVLTFLDIKSGEQNFYHAFGLETGDGVACVSAHPNYPIFGFSERKYFPSIYIMLYPSLMKLQTLHTDHITKYIDIRFNDSEYLICLTGFPNYTIVVWNYRKGTIMGEYQTGFQIEKQELLCGTNSNICAQLSLVSREINVWEINASGEKVFLLKKNIQLYFVRAEADINMTFGVDGNLYLIDSDGKFMMIQTSTCSSKKLWIWNDEIEQNATWHISTYKGGFLIFGSGNKLKYLKKEKVWNVVFSIELNSKIIWSKGVNNYEKIYFLNSDNKLLLLEDNLNDYSLKEIRETGPFVQSFSIIHPYAKYVGILLKSNEIRIVDIMNGMTQASLQIDKAKIFKSLTKIPVLVVGCSDGKIVLISCNEPKNPKIITDFKFNNYPISEILITDNFMVTFDESKNFFIIKGKIGGQLSVVKYFPINYDIFKVLTCEINSNKLKIYINPWRKNELQNEIIVYLYENGEIIEKIYPLKFSIVDAIVMEQTLLVAKFQFNEIYELTFKDDETVDYSLWQKTNHLIKYMNFYGIENVLMTWSFDGIIATYTYDSKNINYIYSVQNRRNMRDFIIMGQCTTNQKRCLILTKRGTLKSYTSKENIAEVAINTKTDVIFNTETITPFRSISGRSWIENMKYEKIQMEKEKYANERLKIIENFNVVKKKLQLLVDENEGLEDPEDRVPLSSLNLAKEYAQNITDKARKNREAEDKILKQFIADQNRITNLILGQTWSHMLTKNQKVFAIFSHLACENYALSQFDLRSFQNFEEKLLIARKRECSSDVFHPFLPPWQKEITKAQTFSKEESVSLDSKTDEEIIKNKEQYALSGTATYLYVTPHPSQYHQFETVTFNQMFIQEFLVAFDVRQLKQCFNKIFEVMVKVKCDTIKYVKTRNERFREIQSEMNALAALRGEEPKYTTFIEDPELEPHETPDSITKVENWEVKIKPYISASEQKLLAEIAYKEELRRLALLADDFRERALIIMMDGVLEKRWEEEIKKNVPIPDFILKNKDPAEYTKEDLKAIIEYEEKVKFILSERERYRVMLTEEERKLQAVQDDNILKFNLKCGELFLQKLNHDAAVKHEELKLLRTSLFNFQRMKFRQKEKSINHKLIEKRQKVEELSIVIKEIEAKVIECQQKYEQLQNRDRGLERGFKSQFGESAPAFVVDTAFKYFKRRPKWQQKAWASATIYVELANIIANKNALSKDFPLPDECYEYLNLLENNDNYTQAPNLIDQKIWEILCRLRRGKIESEFKLKAVGLQLAEAEATHNLFLKDISNTKMHISLLEKDLHDLNVSYQEFIKNRTVQIVLPMGYVEVPLNGQMSNFQGSLLLSIADIADINAIIKRAGEKKLKTMHRLAVFRRKVLMKEWEHKALQMSVQDLRDFLNVIQNTNVTYEMRQWLREKAENRVVEINNAYLTRKVEAKVDYLNKAVLEIEEKIEECQAKIKMQIEENSKLDKGIKCLNVDVTQQNLNRDVNFEQKQAKEQKERMAICMERSRLIRNVQRGHLQMLELATLLELQKLRTFPTLNPVMKNLCSNLNNN